MTQETHDDSVGAAVAWLLLGVAGGLGLDIFAKELLATYPLNQFVFLRTLAGLTIFMLLARQFGGIRRLATRRWKWHLLRTALACGAMFGFFYALARMPLVNALTLAFTAPLVVTALTPYFLGEHVGWRRWTAVLVGFGGVLLILRPGGYEQKPAKCIGCTPLTVDRQRGRNQQRASHYIDRQRKSSFCLAEVSGSQRQAGVADGCDQNSDRRSRQQTGAGTQDEQDAPETSARQKLLFLCRSM